MKALMSKTGGRRLIWAGLAGVLVFSAATADVLPIVVTAGNNFVIARCLKSNDQGAGLKMKCVLPLDDAGNMLLAKGTDKLTLLNDQIVQASWFAEVSPVLFPAPATGNVNPPGGNAKIDHAKYLKFFTAGTAPDSADSILTVPIKVAGHDLPAEAKKAATDASAQQAYFTFVANAIDDPVNAAVSLRAEMQRALAAKFDANGRIDGVDLGVAPLHAIAQIPTAQKSGGQTTLTDAFEAMKAQLAKKPETGNGTPPPPAQKDSNAKAVWAIAVAAALALVLIILAVGDAMRWRRRRNWTRNLVQAINNPKDFDSGESILHVAALHLNAKERKTLRNSQLGLVLTGGYQRAMKSLQKVRPVATDVTDNANMSELENAVNRLVTRLKKAARGPRTGDGSNETQRQLEWCAEELHRIVLGGNIEDDAYAEKVHEELKRLATRIDSTVDWLTLPNLVNWFHIYRVRTRKLLRLLLAGQTEPLQKIDWFLNSGGSDEVPDNIRRAIEAQTEAVACAERANRMLRDYAPDGNIEQRAEAAQAVARLLAEAAKSLYVPARAGTAKAAADAVIAELNGCWDQISAANAAVEALTTVDDLLRAYAVPNGQQRSDSTLQRAKLAREVAEALDRVAREFDVDVSAGDVRSRVDGLAEALRSGIEERAQARRILRDYTDALELLKTEVRRLNPEYGEVAQMSLQRLVSFILKALGLRNDRVEDLEQQLSAAMAKIEVLTREIVNKDERYEALRSEAERIRSGLETVLETTLQKVAGIGPDRLTDLGVRDKASGKLDTRRAQRLVDSLDVKFLVLLFAYRLLSHEITALQDTKRDDVIDAVYLTRISNGLSDLHSRCVQFSEQNAGQPFDAETFYRSVFIHCFQDGWLHLLFRADCVGAAYFANNPALRRLQSVLALAAKIVELLLRDAEVSILLPALFSVPTGDDVRKRFGVEDKLKSLPEVRKTLAPYIDRGDSVAVDIFEVGLDSPWRQFPPCVVALNLAEWR